MRALRCSTTRNPRPRPCRPSDHRPMTKKTIDLRSAVAMTMRTTVLGALDWQVAMTRMKTSGPVLDRGAIKRTMRMKNRRVHAPVEAMTMTTRKRLRRHARLSDDTRTTMMTTKTGVHHALVHPRVTTMKKKSHELAAPPSANSMMRTTTGTRSRAANRAGVTRVLKAADELARSPAKAA